jgi:hypothetical protein
MYGIRVQVEGDFGAALRAAIFLTTDRVFSAALKQRGQGCLAAFRGDPQCRFAGLWRGRCDIACGRYLPRDGLDAWRDRMAEH